jgi:hypothetical protein
MRDQPRDPAQDDTFEAIITDLRPARNLARSGQSHARGAASRPQEPRSPFAATLTHRQRLRRAGVIALAMLVALGVVLSSVPQLRDSTLRAILPNNLQELVGLRVPLATSLARLPACYNCYFIASDVSWATVRLDGKTIQPPALDGDQPLRLTPGHHTLEWRAEPFQPQHCVISAPYAPSDTCSLAASTLAYAKDTPPAAVVVLRESLHTLDPPHAIALTSAMQAALDHQRVTTSVRPGERYAVGAGTSALAEQPLLATHRLTLDTHDPPDLTCQFDPRTMIKQDCHAGDWRCHDVNLIVRPCHASGANCLQLCASPGILDDLLRARQPQLNLADWLVYGIVRATWDYATPDGRVVATGAPLDIGNAGATGHAVLFDLRWDGLTWQVTPLLAPLQSGYIMLDTGGMWTAFTPLHVAALDLFTAGGELARYDTVTLGTLPADPAAGCLVLTSVRPATHSQQPETEAWFLERFGVLLAANTPAHKLRPDLPLATPAETALAARIAQHLLH